MRELKIRLHGSANWTSLAVETDANNYALVLANLVINEPELKTNYIDQQGINGVIDLSGIFGLHYNFRAITFDLYRKTGATFDFEAFKATYSGQIVDCVFGGTSPYYTGRLNVVEDDHGTITRTISIRIDADPLRYESNYTPSSSGLDITPVNAPGSYFDRTHVDIDASGPSVSDGGTATIPASTDDGADGVRFYVDESLFADGRVWRVLVTSLNNCEVYLNWYDSSTLNDSFRDVPLGSGSNFFTSTGKGMIIHAYRKDTTQSASFFCSIFRIITHDVVNSGKPVPFEVYNTLVPNPEVTYNRNPKIYVNGTVFTCKRSATWKEYAPAMLKTGTNKIAAFVDNFFNYDADHGTTGSTKIRYRKGAL